MAFSEEALPQSAVKIIESYNQQVEKAGMVFAASKKMSAVEAIKKLSIEQQKYTKSGDLDNALAIKSKIDYYKEEITSGDMGRISAKIAVDMIDFPKFDEGKIKKVNFKAEVKASSSFDLTFAPGNAIDGMLSSEWASRGSVGDITITLKALSEQQRSILFPGGLVMIR